MLTGGTGQQLDTVKNKQEKHLSEKNQYNQTIQKYIKSEIRLNLQVSVAYLMCSPLQVLIKSCTCENNVSKSGMLGIENFTNLKQKNKRFSIYCLEVHKKRYIFIAKSLHVGSCKEIQSAYETWHRMSPVAAQQHLKTPFNAQHNYQFSASYNGKDNFQYYQYFVSKE